MTMLSQNARTLHVPLFGSRGRGGPVWPPPDEANLAHAWDFRSSTYLTLSGSSIDSVYDRVDVMDLGALTTTRPTWDAVNKAQFDTVDDWLVAGIGTQILASPVSYYQLVYHPDADINILLNTRNPNNNAAYYTQTGAPRTLIGGTTHVGGASAQRTGSWVAEGWVWVGSTSIRFYNPTYVTQDVAGVGAGPFRFSKIGSYSVAGEYGGFNVAMILVYAAQHSDTVAASITSWLEGCL